MMRGQNQGSGGFNPGAMQNTINTGLDNWSTGWGH
jgi:hypothetical protein